MSLLFSLRKFALATLSSLAFVASNVASHEVFALHCLEGIFGFFLVRHLNKSETTASASFPIVDDFSSFDHSMSFERFSKGDVVNTPCEISYKYVHT